MLDPDLIWLNLINCDHLRGLFSQGNTISHYASHLKEEPWSSRHLKDQTAEHTVAGDACPWP